jgi:2-polyprenyl-3-methyl-5-hydroxy-6-metoxy-1,4-benzoquinol methylase
LDSDYARRYRELYEKHWWWRAREEKLCEELKKHLDGSSPKTILDVGCGDGLFFDRLRQFGSVEGVEPVAELVNPNGANAAQITVAPFDANFQPGKKYDVILMLDVLEHLDAPEEALRHALSLLQNDGLLFVTVPAFRLLWTNHDRLNQHRTRFTKASFTRLAISAGMKAVEIRYFFFWLFPAKLVARFAEAILGGKPQIPRVPSPRINRFLYGLSRAEEKIARNLRLNIPFGSSLLVAGRRGATGKETGRGETLAQRIGGSSCRKN